MISKDRIQEAHDILDAVILRRKGINLSFDAEAKISLHAVHDCLCWILEHEGGITFQNNLDRVKSEIMAQGYSLERLQ